MKGFRLTVLALVFLTLVGNAFAITQLINLQGRVTDSSGDLVNNGNVMVYIFNASIGTATAQNEADVLQRWTWTSDTTNYGLRLEQNRTPTTIAYDWKMRAGSATDLNVMSFNAGNVGIGTTTPTSGLEVKGNITINLGSNLDNALIFDSLSGGSAIIRSETKGATSQDLAFFTTFATPQERMRITGQGFVGIAMDDPSVELDVTGDIEYTGTITDVSDVRLKENFETIDAPVSKLQALRGLYFNMIGSDRRELGVIAQDVEKVLPEAVSVVDPEEGYLGVSYPQLVPVLIEAVKEQQEEIDALKDLVCQDHPEAEVCK